MKTRNTLIAITAALALQATAVFAQPIVTNSASSICAFVTDPLSLSFGADGALYVGRDNSGSVGGSGDAVKIHRVAPGGSPVVEFGNAPIGDPDVVIVDTKGIVSGTPGAVLVGGAAVGTSSGVISKITPDGSVTAWFGPSADYNNPSGFAFDSLGRLLFTAYGNGRIYRTDGGIPQLLFTLASANYLEVDSADRIVVNSADETRLRLYTSSGTLSNASFATVKAGTPLARGLGGAWGTDIYAVGTGGELLRVALDSTTTTVGSGFAAIFALVFGADGALYASDFDNDLVWRIVPADEWPRLAISREGSVARLTWSSVINQSYQLQSATNLPATTWTAEGEPFTGTGGVLMTNLPIGLEAKRFFRLIIPAP